MINSVIPSGKYLSRYVFLKRLPSLDEFDPGIGNSTVLLWLSSARTIEECETIAKRLLFGKPLAVLFGGANCECLWNETLRQAQFLSHRMPICSYSDSDLNACIADLFHGTFPAEEDFVLWRGYVIVCASSDITVVQEVVTAFLHVRGSDS